MTNLLNRIGKHWKSAVACVVVLAGVSYYTGRTLGNISQYREGEDSLKKTIRLSDIEYPGKEPINKFLYERWKHKILAEEVERFADRDGDGELSEEEKARICKLTRIFPEDLKNFDVNDLTTKQMEMYLALRP